MKKKKKKKKMDLIANPSFTHLFAKYVSQLTLFHMVTPNAGG